MPEGIEVEYYRRAAESALGRTVAGVVAEDAWYLKGETSAEALAAELTGTRFTAARRIGKLLLLDTDGGAVLGLRFGMTGRLVVDDHAVIDRLEYSSRRDDPAWDRFVVHFVDGGHIAIRDPRRLGGVELDPDPSLLGVDAWAVTAADLTEILDSSAPLKSRLMDQRRLAGLGNLLTDEILFRASLHPARPARTLSPADRRRLLDHVRRTLAELTDRGGSHTGDLQPFRHEGARCPRDGSPLERRQIGGRTTYACSSHQAHEDDGTG